MAVMAGGGFPFHIPHIDPAQIHEHLRKAGLVPPEPPQAKDAGGAADRVPEGSQLSKADESLLEMFVNLLGSPDILQVAKAFRAAYKGPLQIVLERTDQEQRDHLKALARALDWPALRVALLSERLEQGLAARSLKAVLASTAELQEVSGGALPTAETAQAGLMMHEFRCPTLEQLPNFEGMESTRQIVVQQIRYVPGAIRIDSDAALFKGFLRIEKAGEYKLWTESLDGSRLWLDGKRVVENDGRRHGHHWPHVAAAQELEGKAVLSAGLHKLCLEWFAHKHWEHQHQTQLVLRYGGPDTGGAKVDVPPDVLHQGHLPISERLARGARGFLRERLASGSAEDVVVPALAYYSGSVGQTLQEVPQHMRQRLVVCMMQQAQLFENRSVCDQTAFLPKEIVEEVDEAVLGAFFVVSRELVAQGEEVASLHIALQRPLRFLRGLCGQPPEVVAGRLRSAGSPEAQQKLREALREAAGAIGWQELAEALKFLELVSAFEEGAGEAGNQDEPVLSALAHTRADYLSDGTVDLSSMDHIDEAQLRKWLLLFPKATRLFLPKHVAASVGVAEKILPSTRVLHLGALLSPQDLKGLEAEYATTRELWVSALPTSPALRELLELFPEPAVVAFEGSLGIPSSAELDNPGEVESPVFEMGDSVSEFTCAFEFQLHKHQVPGEVYQVCVGQWGHGHGDFVVGWSKHWANGQDTIIFQYEGNQGGAGRIMHGGKCCGFNMSGALNDGEWHKVVVLYDANSKTCTLYADGLGQTETQTWNHCNPLRLGKVTIGEQGAFTREGRRPDRRFPPGQLRNVRLFDSLVPPELLFGRAGLEPPEIKKLRQERPGVQIIAQSIVPSALLRKMLQRYREDRTVDLSECEGLTKMGLAVLMDFFPEVQKIFIAGCGCTPDLRILPAPGAAGDGKARWSERVRYCRKRNEPEWKDLAAVFLTRKMAKVISGAADFTQCGEVEVDEIMDLVLQLSNLGVDASEGADRERAGLFLVRQALADPESARLGLLDAAAYLHRDGRSYLEALPAKQRAVLARLIIIEDWDGLGMQPKRIPTKQMKECAAADTALLEAFKAGVEESFGTEDLRQALRHMRALFRGPLVEIVETFDDEDHWGAVRDAAQSIDWGDLREAFSMALLQPRTLKLKVKKKQLVTEEVVEAYEAPKSADAEDPLLCVVCAAEPEYRLSTDCPHYFCSTCARRSLEAIKDAGQFPAYCPGCRAHSALEGLAEPAVGRLQTPALALLERRGVIAWDFQLQFLRQHAKDPEEHFQCPGKCGEYLVACAPQFMAVAKGEHEHEGFKRMMRLGECPCGAKMCVKCREVVTTDHRGRHEHECPPAKSVQDPHEEESVKAMERLGRRCPNCGIFLEMNGGCDIMMCGTEAHGRLDKALANGGCGYQFHWESGEPAHSFYIGLNGQRVEGIVGTRG